MIRQQGFDTVFPLFSLVLFPSHTIENIDLFAAIERSCTHRRLPVLSFRFPFPLLSIFFLARFLFLQKKGFVFSYSHSLCLPLCLSELHLRHSQTGQHLVLPVVDSPRLVLGCYFWSSLVLSLVLMACWTCLFRASGRHRCFAGHGLTSSSALS